MRSPKLLAFQFELKQTFRGGVPVPLRHFVYLLFGLATLSMVAGVALELGAWREQAVMQGPFPTEPANRIAIVPVPWVWWARCCLEVRGDTNTDSNQSKLRVWLNELQLDPPHMLHEEIRSGRTTGYSHWYQQLYFHIPDKVENDKNLSLRLEYRITVERWILFASSVLSFVSLLLVFGVDPVARIAIKTLLAANQFLIVLGALAFCVYVSMFAVGLVVSDGLPASYIFKVLPYSKVAVTIERFFPVVLLSIALFTVMCGWMSSRIAAHSIRRGEVQALHLWGRLGLLAILGFFFVFIAAGSWSGNVLQRDQPYLNIAGLIPHSDARGYFGTAIEYLLSAHLSDWSARRPLGTIFRALTEVLGNFDYVGTLLAQIGLLSISVFLATSAIMRWRGFQAGTVFVAMAYVLCRPFLVTTMTESLSLFWAFLSIPVLIYGLERHSTYHMLVWFALFAVALFVRMGAMFVIPLVIIWFVLFSDKKLSARLKNGLAAFVIIVAVFAVNLVIPKLYGTVGSQVGSNYAWTLCGISIGGTWADCMSKYSAELAKTYSEAEAANLFYRIAFENIIREPSIFISSMVGAVLRFLSDLTQLPLNWYAWPWTPPPLIWVLYAVSFFGWGYTLYRRGSVRIASFVVLFAFGVLISVPFVYFEDAKRVLYPTYPLLAALIAGGLYFPSSVRPTTPARVSAGGYAALLAGTLIVGIAMPVVLHVLGLQLKLEAFAHRIGNERIITGHRYQTGVLVVPDTALFRADVPSMKLTTFRNFMKAANIDPDTAPNPLPEPPFAFIYSYGSGAYNSYVVPPEVFTRKSVEFWRITEVPFNPEQDWKSATNPSPVIDPSVDSRVDR